MHEGDGMKLDESVILKTIELIEKINNQKKNSVTLGSENMTFFRNEGHIIKFVGEEPGIYSSEIARRFGVTRAVIQKSLGKLEQRGMLCKSVDESDRKRMKIYLTDKGKVAYTKLLEHQHQINKKFFDCISAMSAQELETINKYLSMTINVLDEFE